MAVLTGVTLGRKTWIPQFVQDINYAKCIGCGKCFKACGRNVLLLQAMNEEGEFVDEDEEESERKVMTIVNPDNCIGCQACSRVCPKNCYNHAPLDVN
jgi:Nif-specific ferredoxin III